MRREVLYGIRGCTAAGHRNPGLLLRSLRLNMGLACLHLNIQGLLLLL